MIAFIGRETLSVLNACPRKIPAVVVLVLENVFVKKWAYRKKIERRDLFVFFYKFTFGFQARSSTKVENNSIRFLNRYAEENFVVNNKDNRVFISRNYRSNNCMET